MLRPNIRPWRDQAELLSTRRLLYPDSETGAETRHAFQQLGVNIVNTWKRRCRVPHSIYSTAVLVDATLHHDVAKSSTFAIRAVYSTAFARFVTGFCDIGQNSTVKRSMYEVAEAIGLPEAWVELRHEITHGQIPDLRSLETCVQAALTWLWDVFWIKLDAVSEDALSEVETLAEFRDVLKAFLSSRRDEIKRGKTEDLEASSAAHASRKLLRLCKHGQRGIQLLVSVLLEEKMMLPSQRQVEVSMKPAFLIWDRLLQAIAVNRQACYPNLLNSMLDQITEAPDVEGSTESKKNALLQWLVHMLTSASWVAIGQPSGHMNTNIIESCLLNPNLWTQKLAKVILDCSEEDFRHLWNPMYEASLLDAQDSLGDVSATEDNIGTSHQADTTVPEADMDSETPNHKVSLPDYPLPVDSRDLNAAPLGISRSHGSNINEGSGWTLWEGPWIPKPIGMS